MTQVRFSDVSMAQPFRTNPGDPGSEWWRTHPTGRVAVNLDHELRAFRVDDAVWVGTD